MNLAVDLAPQHKVGLPLQNPIMIASGFGGYGLELAHLLDLSRLGAFVTSPLSLHPWRGAPAPRLQEVPAGFLLRTGNQNPGLRQVLRLFSKMWAGWTLPVIVRLAGANPAEIGALAARLENVEGVAAVELQALPEEGTFDAVHAVREASLLPLLVVLPLGCAADVPQQCAEAGADALVVGAPPPGVWMRETGQASFVGELYGPGMLPQVLYELRRLAPRATLPLVARGGVHTAEDALACLFAGAQAVQVDSAILRYPAAPLTILEGIEEWMREQRVEELGEVIGRALPRRAV